MIWIGSISYSLYLLHPLIGGRVMNFCERFPNFIFVQIISVPMALFFSIIAAYLFFRAMELPSHQLARRMKGIKNAKH
jgi:peptidoglycan/LPS O-acetylase OafA/YrhL